MPVPKVSANGRLAASKATIFTATRYCVVTFFSLSNTAATAETTIIYVKPVGGTSRQIHSAVLGAALAQSRVVSAGERLNLSSGDIIEGQSTNANAVDYLISVEEH